MINLRKLIDKIICVTVVVLFITLVVNKNNNIKTKIFNEVYNSNISFAKIKKIYNNYLGSIIPIENIVKEKEVFNEKIKYNELSQYDKGVKLKLDSNYSIPIIKGGIVVFIGNKDNLNKTVIIEDKEGVNYYYGNLDLVNVKLYDYVSKNDLLGTSKDNTLYLLFSKEGKYLDYKEFLK